MVNSAAHLYGSHPYDVNIFPAENKFVSLMTNGEGFHNYHHTFPQDYGVSEWGHYFNLTTMFIDLMAFLGLAYGRKSMSEEIIQKRIQRTGPNAKKTYLADMDY